MILILEVQTVILNLNMLMKRVGIAKYNGNVTGTMLTIPEMVNGEKIVEICSNAFNEKLWNKEYSNIETVIIPSTVKKINSYAFCNFISLKNIIFEPDSLLTEISDYAFTGCSIENVNLPSSLLYIGKKVFNDCIHLNNITITSNSNYSSYDGVLYDKDKSKLIIYPIGKNNTSFEVPSSVNTIGSSAFLDNQYLESINLKNVVNVMDSSFKNCINLTEIVCNDLKYVHLYAFEGTKWLQEQGDCAVLGKSLIKYNGDKTVLLPLDFPINIMSIASGAFSNTQITKIELPLYISLLNNNTFINMDNLEELWILNQLTVFDEILYNSNENVIIYIKKADLSYYETVDTIRDYNIQVVSTNAILNYEDGSSETITLYYGENYELPSPLDVNYSYNWYDSQSNYYKQSGIWEYKDKDLILNAKINEHVKWILNDEIIYECNLLDGDIINFNNNNIIINGKIVKTVSPNLYYYLQCYTNENGIKNIINEYLYDGNFKNIYIENIPIIYTINIENANFNIENPNLIGTITQKYFTIEDITNIGLSYFDLYHEYRDFDGLYTDNECSEDCKIISPYIIINIASTTDNTIYAKWDKKYYEVKLNYNNELGLVMVSVEMNEVSSMILSENIMREHYTGKWWDGTYSYEFGSTYIVTKNSELEIIWTPKEYEITYLNLYNAQNNNRASYNIETETFTLNLISRMHFTSDGWYTDSHFINRINNVEKGTSGEITLYARWEFNELFTREGSEKITDSGRFNQYRDRIDIFSKTNYKTSDLKAQGYTSLTITITIDLWEIYDGYQHIWIYDEFNENAKQFFYQQIEHGPGEKDTTVEHKILKAIINLDEISGNDFYIVYGASGSGADTWQNKELEVKINALEKRVHLVEDTYIWRNNTSHFCKCNSCDKVTDESHVVPAGSFAGGQTTATCLLCGGQATFGIVGQLNIGNKMVSENGSFILENGVIILVEEDMEFYLLEILKFHKESEEVI